MAKIGEQFIFIVDDDAAVCRAIHETLEESGAKVSSFTDASDCIDQLRSQRCDLLIADLRMPGMDGLELLRRVRVLVPQVPVMMITGYGDVPLAVEAMKSGAVDFIEKPLVKSDFLRKVRSLLGQNTFVETRHGLTRTEAKVLTLILAGKSNKEMATALNRSKRTNELPRRKRTGYPFEEDSFSYRRKRRGIQPKEIETHRAHVMEKLGVDSMVDLVKLAVKIGLVDLAIDHVYSETPHASEPD